MLTFHNDQRIKDKYIARVKAHAAAAEIIKGKYWEGGKGCAVGCTIHGDNHQAYEDELGIPSVLARLEDSIFEGLPNEIAKDFPWRFLDAIDIGLDLKALMVFEKFMLWLLVDDEYGVYQYGSEDGKIAIQTVADLYVRKINGEIIETTEWLAVRNTACIASASASTVASASASASAVASAVASAAAVDADAAAIAADAAAIAAAYADAAPAFAYDPPAAYATAITAARQNHRIAQAHKIIQLLQGCKKLDRY